MAVGFFDRRLPFPEWLVIRREFGESIGQANSLPTSAFSRPMPGRVMWGTGIPVVPAMRVADFVHRAAIGAHASGMLTLRVPVACSGLLNEA